MKRFKLDREDFDLLAELNSREYQDNSMSSNSSEEERERFRIIKDKLKSLAKFF